MDEFEVVVIEQSLAKGVKSLPSLSRQEDGFTRGDVVNAFHRAFQMIGGVQRMALWADKHPDKFYPLYARLMPATTVQIGQLNNIVIEHALAPTALDVHPPQEEKARGDAK